MSELTSGTEKKKLRTLHIIIAVLAVASLAQAAALVIQHQRHAVAANVLPARTTAVVARGIPPAAPLLFADPRAEDPFEEFDAVSRRMSNMMRRAFMSSAPLMRSLGATGGFDFTPAVDLEETENAYILRGDLPGLDKDKISVTVKNNILTLEGMRETTNESQDSKKGYYSQERSYGSFSRSLSLPGPVDETKVNAEYKNGVLTVSLPKIKNGQAVQKVAIR